MGSRLTEWFTKEKREFYCFLAANIVGGLVVMLVMAVARAVWRWWWGRRRGEMWRGEAGGRCQRRRGRGLSWRGGRRWWWRGGETAARVTSTRRWSGSTGTAHPDRVGMSHRAWSGEQGEGGQGGEDLNGEKSFIFIFIFILIFFFIILTPKYS